MAVVYVNLQIAGAPSAEQGRGSWGCEALFNDRDQFTSEQTGTPIDLSGNIGNASKHAAEYMALIGALRGLLRFFQGRSIRCTNVQVEAITDYKPLVDEMTGEATPSSSESKILHDVAKGLDIRFLRVRYRHDSAGNKEARRVCQQALVRKTPANSSLIYYPALAGFVNVWIEGEQTLGSHDLLARGTDATFFVDAQYLRDNFGSVVLRNLDDPYPLSLVSGRAQMTVLGSANLEFGMSWVKGETQPLKSGLTNVVVVDSLPVPFHISSKQERITFFDGDLEISLDQCTPFKSDRLPPRFRDHPFWLSLDAERG